MQIRTLTLREIHLKLLAPFETSMDRVTERRILLAELNLDSATGWGDHRVSDTCSRRTLRNKGHRPSSCSMSSSASAREDLASPNRP